MYVIFYIVSLSYSINRFHFFPLKTAVLYCLTFAPIQVYFSLSPAPPRISIAVIFTYLVPSIALAKLQNPIPCLFFSFVETHALGDF